ncbi:MAG: hydroxyacid dehydrogenase [Phycisphaerales bacterium]|nr:hydroxyacid dehydrogenase [Phycisphaerales bacterium]
MKILVACELSAAALEQLASLGDVSHRPDLTAAELRDAISDVGVLVVGRLRVAADVIARAKTLQMIVHAGRGAAEVAVEEASAQGIFVTHVPDRHADALAELVFGLILALDRRLVEYTLALREGRWARSAHADARGLAGRTLGLLGCGMACRLIADRGRAFGMRAIVWSPTLVPTPGGTADLETYNWPREVARQADVVVVLPLPEDERGTLIDEEFLGSMKPGASLVHVGSPGAVDEQALAEVAPRRNLRVATDVYATAPTTDTARFRTRLADLPGFVGTQQVATLTEQCRAATADEVVRIVRAFVVSGEVINPLNLTERSPATWQLVLRVRDQVGVMASILEAIRADGINAQEISSRVFLGAKAAWCTVALDERPSADALEAVRALPDVLHLELRAVV